VAAWIFISAAGLDMDHGCYYCGVYPRRGVMGQYILVVMMDRGPVMAVYLGYCCQAIGFAGMVGGGGHFVAIAKQCGCLAWALSSRLEFPFWVMP